MLPELSNAIILFGGGLALLLAVVQLFHDRSRIKNILLFMIFVNLGIIHIYEYVVSVSPGYHSSAARNILLMAKFILGPSMYIFYLTVFRRGYRHGYAVVGHFVPAAGAAFYVIFMYASEGNSSGVIFSIREYLSGYPVYEYLHSLGFALIFVYTAAILMKMEIISLFSDEKKSRLFVVGAIVSILLFTAALLIVIVMITGNRTVLRMALSVTTLFFIYWFVIVQIHPELFSSSIKKRKGAGRSEDPLHGIDIRDVEGKLKELMEVEKLYCDEDLSLKKLAELIDLQPGQFSLYLNHRRQVNFNTFINRYRVEEAIRMMDEERKRSLLSIAFSAGFNSKSVFYDAFTKHTGLSPAKYRKQFFSAKKS